MAAPATSPAAELTVRRYTNAELDAWPDDGHRYELVGGVLIVTPPPGTRHEVAVRRILVRLAAALGEPEIAHVVGRSEIRADPDTKLEPDLLVFPAGRAIPEKWTDIKDWWLAVEVYSRSSRAYDRDTKRAAYLTLGVPEVWLVDPEEREITAWKRGDDAPIVHQAGGTLRWTRPELPAPVELPVADVFRGIGADA